MSTLSDNARRMAVQGLAGEIVAALLADENDGGYDLTSGLFGAAFSALVRRWADAELAAQVPHSVCIGASITEGALHVAVQQHGPGKTVRLLGTARMDLELLKKQDCIVGMTPPDRQLLDDYATEINRLRNVIQAACLGGTDMMIERWKALFPDAPVPTVKAQPIQFEAAEEARKDRQHAEAYYRQAEFLLTSNEKTLHQRIADLEAQLKAPQAQGVPADFHSHRDAWRRALTLARDSAEVSPPDIDDRAYWAHELAVFDRAYGELAPQQPHVLFKTGDADAPAQILDRNGEVALACCKVCGKAEAELTDVECPPDPAFVDRALAQQDEREVLRAAQAAAVMPMIGPLLDAWEGADREAMEEEPELAKWLGLISSAMENAASEPACKTCNDNGLVGGPSFYAPDEGGMPCPECSGETHDDGAATRLRGVCDDLGLGSAIPETNERLMAMQFSVFGMIRRALAKAQQALGVAADERKRVIELAKHVGLIGWVSEGHEYFSFSDERHMSSKLIELIRAAAPQAAPVPQTTTAPVVSEPSGKNWHAHHLAVNKAALQMVRNALRNDAEAGKTVRAEMLEELDKATFAIPAPQPASNAPAPQALTEREPLAEERERLCAAIKAEDDYCVTHGDYMLDSNDCVKIIRGEWVRPGYSAGIGTKGAA